MSPEIWSFIGALAGAIFYFFVQGKEEWQKDKLASFWGGIIALSFFGGVFSMIPYVLVYPEKHGTYTKLFKSSETIDKEKNQKLKKIKSEVISCVAPEKSISWEYLYDYDTGVQKSAISKLSKCNENNKVIKKLSEISSDYYQNGSVRVKALCAIESSYYSYDMDDFFHLLFEYDYEIENCLSNKTISESSGIQEEIIRAYERSGGKDAKSLIRRVLKYNEDTRSKYANYLKNYKNSFFNRVFEDGLIDWFTNEDLIHKIDALKSVKLIQGDPNIKEALEEILKVSDVKVIYKASSALEHAYIQNKAAQEILAMHLKSENIKIRTLAVNELNDFRPLNRNTVIISSLIPLLSDEYASIRFDAIEILKPSIIFFKTIIHHDDEIYKYLLQAYNEIKRLAKSDLDEDVRKAANDALPKITYSSWITPSHQVCKKHASINNNTCVTSIKSSAEDICKESGGRLPRIEELIHERFKCSAGANKIECLNEKGFNVASSYPYLSSNRFYGNSGYGYKSKSDLFGLNFDTGSIEYDGYMRGIVKCVKD